jgi:hypothetical protein
MTSTAGGCLATGAVLMSPGGMAYPAVPAHSLGHHNEVRERA